MCGLRDPELHTAYFFEGWSWVSRIKQNLLAALITHKHGGGEMGAQAYLSANAPNEITVRWRELLEHLAPS